MGYEVVMIKISKHSSSPERNTTLELSPVWDLNVGKKPKAHSKEMVKQNILQKLLRTKDDPILERNQIQKICELQPYENKRLAGSYNQIYIEQYIII